MNLLLVSLKIHKYSKRSLMLTVLVGSQLAFYIDLINETWLPGSRFG